MPHELHPEAAKRFNELADKLLSKAAEAPAEPQRQIAFKPEVYTQSAFQKEDLTGPISFSQSIVNGAGQTVGWLFEHHGKTVGLVGSAYEELLNLGQRLHSSFEETTSLRFITETLLDWVKGRYTGAIQETLSEYVSRQSEKKVKDFELWLPIYRLYLQSPLQLGRVTFQTITKSMLDDLEARINRAHPDATGSTKQYIDRQRKSFQGYAAACVPIRAEHLKAREVASVEGRRALALLRFFSIVNWIPNRRSYCDLVGQENTRVLHELEVHDGTIKTLSASEIDEGDSAWSLADISIARFPGLISNLNRVLTGTSDFSKSLLDALLLYSRNSLVADPTDKLVYIFVGLESVLLKDRNEPIQKNIGERMAFLIGDTLESRKAIVANVSKVYELRSSFVHHGQLISDLKLLEEFMLNAWTCFYTLVQAVDRIQTKLSLIETLEDRKMR